jgi:hypothetical protein
MDFQHEELIDIPSVSSKTSPKPKKATPKAKAKVVEVKPPVSPEYIEDSSDEETSPEVSVSTPVSTAVVSDSETPKKKQYKPEKKVYVKIINEMDGDSLTHRVEMSIHRLKATVENEYVVRKTVVGPWDISAGTEGLLCLFHMSAEGIQSVMVFQDKTKAVNKFFKEMQKMAGSDDIITSTLSPGHYLATLGDSSGNHVMRWGLIAV